MKPENGKMVNLPNAFVERMKKQLPKEEWNEFFGVYKNPPVKGIRVNLLKCDVETFKEISPYELSPVSWEDCAFSVKEERVGGHPYHFAGVYYSQEPSATCAAPLLDVQGGERVLDLCSAPGGKGTQLAAKMGGKGLIVLNEPVYSRAKILSQNVERMGIKNALVTCATPQELKKVFKGCFDKILIDAPCSGEGMFRKNAEEALTEWSEENVALCARRQEEILDAGTEMLKKGGRLVYSTCTFSIEEDEGQTENYLKKHTEMRLIKKEKLYPHKIVGEGHFAALFERTEGGEETYVKERKPSVKRESEAAYRVFEKEFFKEKFAFRLYEANGVLYELPENTPDWKNLQILRVGVRLGEMKNGRFEPDHSLALCAKKEECKRVITLKSNDERLEKFLRGETLLLTAEEQATNGWCLVTVDGFAVGLGKIVGDTVKNHIPKGLRKL